MADYIKREAAIVAIKNLYPGIPLVKRNMERWHPRRHLLVCRKQCNKNCNAARVTGTFLREI